MYTRDLFVPSRFVGFVKAREGSQEKRRERKKLTGLGALRRWDDDDACTFFFDASSAVGGGKALTVDDASDLQVEFVLGMSSSATEWYPTYVSSDNSNKTLTSGNDDGGGISSSYWSYSEGSGYEQISDYGLKVFAYENDGIMGNMDTTDGAALSFEVWKRVANEDNWKSNVANSPRGWVMSYETGWGPAMCLKDNRVNNGGSGGVGTTPGDDTNQGIDTGSTAHPLSGVSLAKLELFPDRKMAGIISWDTGRTQTESLNVAYL